MLGVELGFIDTSVVTSDLRPNVCGVVIPHIDVFVGTPGAHEAFVRTPAASKEVAFEVVCGPDKGLEAAVRVRSEGLQVPGTTRSSSSYRMV